MKSIFVAAVLTALFIITMKANAGECRSDNSGRMICNEATTLHARRHLPRYADANGGEARVIGGRPAGCPWKYCGCGLAKFLGLADKRLNLAWNWAKLFPRTQAQPGAAAVRRGHVMLLVEHLGGTVWKVRDYNGGRHLSWIHARDVRGYVFVMPGQSYAMN